MKCNKVPATAGRVGVSLTPVALPVVLFIVLILSQCSSTRKLSRIRKSPLPLTVSLPQKRTYVPDISDYSVPVRDTLKVIGLDGKELVIMEAVKDEETGQMVATEQLSAAVVTARFRNVAERHGLVELEFLVEVPSYMLDSRWQIRIQPKMVVMGDSLNMDDILVTGKQYRKEQMRGYQQYERFVSKIVSDTTVFVNRRNLDLFLARNIPELYALRNDTTFISDEEFESSFGVSGRAAQEHYTNKLAMNINRRRKLNMDKMFRKFVKVPLITEGIRLDTVILGDNGNYIYDYVQAVNTRPGLRRIDVTMSGKIFESDRHLYNIPESAPLSFYVSSVSSLVDNTERYLTKIVNRRVELSSKYNIEFRQGESAVDGTLGANATSLAEIRRDLSKFIRSDEYELDSITVAASASPEGRLKSNLDLSLRRARSVSGYFEDYASAVADSVVAEGGFFVSVDNSLEESAMTVLRAERVPVFRPVSAGEDWFTLAVLVSEDTVLTELQKEEFSRLFEISDLDEREGALGRQSGYGYIKNELYPRLRSVVFAFHIHRRGMVKDTVMTTELDSLYMSGVQLVRDREYEKALEILSLYNDFNAAVAYVALDRNVSALSILEECSRTAAVNYLLSIVYARLGDDRTAVQCYINACGQDNAFVSRGNLDPEISALIQKYRLNTI